MLSLISPAYAAAGPSGTDFLSFLPLLAVLGVMYFFFFRTQQKKDKQHKELITNLKRGDRVLTNGGMIGVISKVGSEQEVLLEIADGVRVSFLKGMISTVLGQTNLKESAEKEKEKEKKPHLKLAVSRDKGSKTKPTS